MEKAKAAVSEFMHKAGNHETTVHEEVAPAVVNEKIVKNRHEEATTAIDREIHQDHYHTSIQPVTDREVLPEKHVHNIIGVEKREHRHGDAGATKARLEQERQQFQSTRVAGPTHETHSVAPVIAGEHVHHHVHETIQPVIQKENIQPQVIHTTIPIHEIHENEPKHHAASALPAVSLADFKKQGGTVTGREERYDGFEGEPKTIGGALSGYHHHHHSGTTGPHSSNELDRDGFRNLGATSGDYGTRHSGTTSPHSSNFQNKLDPRVDSNRDGSRILSAASGGYGNNYTGSSSYVGTGTHTGTGVHNGTGSNTCAAIGNHSNTDSGYGSGTAGSGYGSGTTTKKLGLLDRLNPLEDADGDGKRGVGE